MDGRLVVMCLERMRSSDVVGKEICQYCCDECESIPFSWMNATSYKLRGCAAFFPENQENIHNCLHHLQE